MRSSRLRALTLGSILLSSSALTAGCAGTVSTPVYLAAQRCSDQIPPSYRKPVSGVGLLSPEATAGEATAKLDGQTAALDTANGRVSDVIGIVDRCDARNAEAAAKLAPKRKRFGLF